MEALRRELSLQARVRRLVQLAPFKRHARRGLLLACMQHWYVAAWQLRRSRDRMAALFSRGAAQRQRRYLVAIFRRWSIHLAALWELRRWRYLERETERMRIWRRYERMSSGP